MNVKDDILTKAESWAASVWREALSRWSSRSGQDKSYRQHVIFPAIWSLLWENFPDRGIHILELGCGDGVFLDHQMGSDLIDNGGAYLGIDISPELIKKARKNHTGDTINFLQGNLTDPALADHIINLNESWNCVLSIFTIQEIPNLESMMGNLGRIIPEGVLAIFVAVHPDFAEWLMRKGRMRKADDQTGIPGQEGIKPGEIQWRWAGYYPIVDEPLEAFYLPYFHRSIEDYRLILEKYGFVVQNIVELPNKQHDLSLLVKRGISPFTPFKNNLYWPRIGEAPSSIAILAWKE